MAWDDDPYDSSLISSIDPRISGNPYIDEAAGLRIQNEYLDRQRRQQQPQQQGGWGQALTQEAERNGLDPDVLQRIIKIESGGDPNNRTGSYGGLFQLSKQEFNKYGGGNLFDPTDNIRAGTAKLAAERDNFKEKYGRDPTATDLYLTHQQGEGGYGQHMANPDRPAWENMFNTGEGRQKGAGWARQAIWGNIPDQYKKQFGSVDNVTSADFVNMWRNKVEGDNPGVMADAPATGSPPGNPVDASNLGSVGASPYGRQRMDDTQQQSPLQGLFSGLFGGGQGQQQQGQQQPGLLGALSDPTTMAYLGMMTKALSPYSNIDPNAMLKNAQLQQQHQQDLALRQQQLGLNTRSQDRQDAEVAYKQRELEQSREASKNIYGDASQPGAGLTREGIFKYMQRYPNMDKSTRDFLESRLAAIENQGKITRDTEERRQLGQQQGLQGKPLDEYVLTGKVSDKPALTATDRKAIYSAEDQLPAIQGTKEALQRALQLNPDVLTGYGAGLAGSLQARLALDPENKKKGEATVEWSRIMSREAISQMSSALKGATTDFELKKFEDILGDPSTPVDVRKRTIERMLTLAQRHEKILTDRFNELRGGEYFKPGGGASKAPGGGSQQQQADPLGIR